MIERIGDEHGLIALYLDKQGALDLAATFGPSDRAHDELLAAVARAYPETESCPECGCPGEQYDGHVCEDVTDSHEQEEKR